MVQQPLLATTVQRTTREPTAAIVAILIGGVSLAIFAFFGCVWSVPFPIVAIVFGIFVSSDNDRS